MWYGLAKKRREEEAMAVYRCPRCGNRSVEYDVWDGRHTGVCVVCGWHPGEWCKEPEGLFKKVRKLVKKLKKR